MEYPILGMNTALHVISLHGKKTLCGITPPRFWEMCFHGQAFPEIGGFELKNKVSLSEGFNIGRDFAPKGHFCKRCYAALKKARGV